MDSLSDAAAQTMLAELGEALRARDRRRVDSLVARSIADNAPLGRHWRALADVSRKNGRLGHARLAISAFVRSSGNAAAARFEQAAFLAELGDLSEATAVLDGLPAGFPDSATRSHLEATIALNQGDLERARALFRSALAARPASGPSWLACGEAMRGIEPEKWVETVVEAERHFEGASVFDRAAYLYARGAALHAIGDHNAAFVAFAAGAALIARMRPYDAERDRSGAEQAQHAFADGSGAASAASRAMFVLGPPRSGTTLVEQILSSHSMVAGGGELGLLDLVAAEVFALPHGQVGPALSRRGAELAADYSSLLDERFPGDGRVVDKTLSTTRLAGFAATVLPDAPLIWVRRNPIDNAWSCFRTFFSRGVAWSWDLRDIGLHLSLEAALLAHWQASLGDRLLVVDYEDLVARPEPNVRAILDHCGLPFESAALAPHAAGGTVTTASVAQVREPINTRAIGAAEPYRRHLQPFLDAYEAG